MSDPFWPHSPEDRQAFAALGVLVAAEHLREADSFSGILTMAVYAGMVLEEEGSLTTNTGEPLDRKRIAMVCGYAAGVRLSDRGFISGVRAYTSDDEERGRGGT